MQFRQFSIQKSVFLKNLLANTVLIVNILVWYSYASTILTQIIEITALTSINRLMSYSVSFCGAVIAIFLGAFLVGKFRNIRFFLISWTLLSIVASLIPVFLPITTFLSTMVFSLLINVSFGFSLPLYMRLFAESTILENRARYSSIVLLITFLITFILKYAMTTSITVNSLILSFWRAAGLIAVPFAERSRKNVLKSEGVSFISILRERVVYLYLIPWTIFSLVNYLAWSINMKFLDEELIRFSTLIENIIAGVFALVAGIISDIFGRKHTVMVGFILFGLGYAILGVFPFNVLSWYFYTIVDGVCWGIIYVVFLFTIWGDIAQGRQYEKYYAIGMLPFSLSSFLHLTVGYIIAEIISPYAIFSFTAFFLFLAVIPLMYAPETLPEKKLRERELKKYIEKAKKIKEKYV
jgi:MFS family permease